MPMPGLLYAALPRRALSDIGSSAVGSLRWSRGGGVGGRRWSPSGGGTGRGGSSSARGVAARGSPCISRRPCAVCLCPRSVVVLPGEDSDEQEEGRTAVPGLRVRRPRESARGSSGGRPGQSGWARSRGCALARLLAWVVRRVVGVVPGALAGGMACECEGEVCEGKLYRSARPLRGRRRECWWEELRASGDGPRRAHIHILIRPRGCGGRAARAELARLRFCGVPIPPSRAAVSHQPAPAGNVFDMCGRQPYVATASQTGVPLSIMYTPGVRACRKCGAGRTCICISRCRACHRGDMKMCFGSPGPSGGREVLV
ncbi:hypothetical protein GY45DRAFT_1009198 [Cubamyces sp. BRFM 1775]|nr:hypothetical protein GY45DRAFT_1009198 [Cubamyces sp. BRFM 1775]